MAERLEQLEQKVEAVADLIDKLQAENQALRDQNSVLRAELLAIKQHYDDLKLSHTDQSNAIREKLHLVLSRLEELEALP